MKLMAKKGNVGGLDNFILSIVGVAMVLGIGLIVLGQFKDTMTADTAEYNATNTLVTKLATIPTWVGIIIVVAMAFLVMSYFYGKYRQG